MSATKRISRRDFLRQSAAGAAAVGLTPLLPPQVWGANDRINLGVIGVGGRGTDLLRDLVERSKDPQAKVKVVAVCDIYEPRKRNAQNLCKGRVFHEYREMLELPDLDAVFIATPDHWHATMSIAAMRAGKDVYCEKPMTLTWQEAREVARVQARTQRVFQCGVQSSSEDRWWQANRLIREGAIGKLIWSQGGYFRNVPGGDWNYELGPVDLKNRKSPHYLDWKRFLGPAPKRPFDPERYFRFRKFWDYSGGIATDLLYHTLGHLAIALGPQFPTRVVATGGNYVHFDREVPDTFNILIDYPPEPGANPDTGHTVALFGTQGNQTGLPDLIRGQEATLYFEDSEVVLQPQGPFQGRRSEQRVASEPRADHITNFLECVRSRQQPHCNAQVAYRVMVAIGLAVESYRHGRVMRFDPQGEELIA